MKKEFFLNLKNNNLIITPNTYEGISLDFREHVRGYYRGFNVDLTPHEEKLLFEYLYDRACQRGL